MPRRGFLTVDWEKKARKAERRMTMAELDQLEAAVFQLLGAELPQGLNYKPILPRKRYYEARINLSLRLVIEDHGNHARIVDICTHDELPKYGR